ncbi:MAG: hypothetical protein JHC33_12355 [Ignisphaera sp.]|nr:hypothetical protein [Ignisphaera sp.]
MKNKWLDNYNDSSVSLPEGYVGEGIFNGPIFENPAVKGQFQMGGNIPGAVGHMYARTGSPSKGPRRNQTDVTDASAQNGKEMQYYQQGLDWKPKSISRDGAWLDQYDVAQNGKKKFKLKDEREDAYTVRDNIQPLSLKQKRGNELLIKETENAKKDKQELTNTGQIKNPRSIHYKKLAPKQADLKTQTKSNEELEGQLGLERPLVYLASPEKLLGDLGVPGMETSELDRQAVMANRFNPNQSREERFINNANIGLGYVPEATVNTAMAAAFMPEGSGALGLVNEALNPFAGMDNGLFKNIPTSIAPELRQGLQTAGISDLYKINPLATKIDDAATKIVGEGKNSFIYDPAKTMYNRTYESTPNFLTGYKKIKKPNKLDFSPIIDLRTEEFKNKALQNFKTLTGGKADDIDLEQFVDYFKKEQERLFTKLEYQDFLSNINREKYYDTPEWKNVWDDSRDQAEDIFGKIEQTLQQKSSPLGKRLGSGAEGSVYELADDPDKVIKIGNTFKTSSADDLVKSFEGITDDNIARVLRAHQDNKHLIEIMPNLNANAKFSNFTKEQVLGKLEKDAKGLMDRGFQLDVDNINGNFRYNPDKNKVDIYDISKPAAGQTSQNPEAVLRILRDHFNNDYRISGTHPSYDPNMPTPEFKQGGIIKDDRGQWAKNKKNLLPLQSNWLNKFE